MRRFISSVFRSAVRSFERRQRRFKALADFRDALLNPQPHKGFTLTNAAFYAACTGATINRLQEIVERNAVQLRGELQQTILDGWEQGRWHFLRGQRTLSAMRERSILTLKRMDRLSHMAKARR